MVWKVNLRTLVNFFGMRLCNRAYWEIRALAKELKDALSKYSPEWKEIADALFVPKCVQVGFCTEEKSCTDALFEGGNHDSQ
jgi:thymidylate synthase (FAD)